MAKKKELILIGGGGHCRSCIDVIEAEGKYVIAGIVDMKEKKGTNVCGYKIIASDDELPRLSQKYKNFLITLGQIKDATKRVAIFDTLKGLNTTLATVISPLAHVSKHALIKEGTIVMHHVLVNTGAVIGINCIINNKALIEHDTQIGAHCHIATASVVNGECVIGEKSFIGSNTVVIQNTRIAPNSVIGAGSVVVNDLEEAGTYVGQPVKRLVRA